MTYNVSSGTLSLYTTTDCYFSIFEFCCLKLMAAQAAHGLCSVRTHSLIRCFLQLLFYYLILLCRQLDHW